MLLETLSSHFRKARSVNQTSNGYVSKIPTVTEPTGDAATATGASVIDIGTDGNYCQNGMIILPYGIGSNNQTMSVRVIGWRKVGLTDGQGGATTTIWIPVVLAEFACTLSSTPIGIAGAQVLNTELFADTITLTYGNNNVSVEIISPAADIIAHAVLDLKGFKKVELSFTTGGSATSCNALVAMY